MSIATSKMLLTIVLVLWLFTLFRSITIVVSGKEIFNKSGKGENAASIPVVNLFTMLEITDISTYYGILFFVPVINYIVLTVMSYKLGSVFNTSFIYKLGLIFVPILFFRTLGKSDKQYKLKNVSYFKAFDSTKVDSVNLMTEEQLEAQNNEEYEEDNVQVDSVFKSTAQIVASDKPAPYKAAKIDLLGMEKLKDEETEKEKNDNMEMLDL